MKLSFRYSKNVTISRFYTIVFSCMCNQMNDIVWNCQLNAALTSAKFLLTLLPSNVKSATPWWQFYSCATSVSPGQFTCRSSSSKRKIMFNKTSDLSSLPTKDTYSKSFFPPNCPLHKSSFVLYTTKLSSSLENKFLLHGHYSGSLLLYQEEIFSYHSSVLMS